MDICKKNVGIVWKGEENVVQGQVIVFNISG